MSHSYAFLSPAPPGRGGLASFTTELMHALACSGPEHVALIGSPDPASVGGIDPGTATVDALDDFDVAVVQCDADTLGSPRSLALVESVRVPVVLVVHAVPQRPSPDQRGVLERAMAAADAVVVLTATARDRLLAGYAVDAARLTVIPPGAADRRGPAGPGDGAPMILTWGMLGPGKGIEWAIGGLPRLKDLRPAPRYVIVGETHPRVRLRDGESYRLSAANRARALRVGGMVRFMPGYLDEDSLTRMIRRADVLLLPDDSTEPVASRVLVEAVAAGKPVVAAAFPHAVELLGQGGGLLVPRGDSSAIGEALLRVLTEPGLAHELATTAARMAPGLLWPAVAGQYRDLVGALLGSSPTGAAAKGTRVAG